MLSAYGQCYLGMPNYASVAEEDDFRLSIVLRQRMMASSSDGRGDLETKTNSSKS